MNLFLAGSGVRWVFAGIFGLFVCSGRTRRLLGRSLVSGDFDTGKSVPPFCHYHFHLSCTYLACEVVCTSY